MWVSDNQHMASTIALLTRKSRRAASAATLHLEHEYVMRHDVAKLSQCTTVPAGSAPKILRHNKTKHTGEQNRQTKWRMGR